MLEMVGVPCGPVNDLEQVFADPHVQARGAELTLAYPDSATGTVSLLANPLKMSETPVTYRHAPPKLDEYREDVLADWLGRTNPSNSE